MPIITLEKTKELLQITDNTKDSLIESLIPLVQDSVCSYCNNLFTNSNFQIISSNIEFVAGVEANPDADPDPIVEVLPTIINTDANYILNGFTDGCEIRVMGSKLNNGTYEVETVSADTLTLKSSAIGEIKNEVVTNIFLDTVIITLVQWPKELWLPVATLIGAKLAAKGSGVKSESLPGGYSVTYETQPELLKSLFRNFRKPYL
jgi:hypothetical protein